ncbi:hypothetical protein NFJ02_10g00570 [Pycnococcus provasolii]
MMLRQKHHRPKSALYLGNHNASRSSPARIAVACVRFIATGLACSALIGLCAVAHRHHVTSASKTKWLVDRRTTVLKPNMPWLIYGTAWKQAETYSLVRRALQPGKIPRYRYSEPKETLPRRCRRTCGAKPACD